MSAQFDDETLADLVQDFAELLAIVDDNIERLNVARGQIFSNALPDTASTVEGVIDNLFVTYRRLHDELSRPLQKGDIAELTREKKRIANIVRGMQGVVGSLIASTDWQSPSFLHAVQSQAGRQTGKISGTVNDYKRDHHMDAAKYENAFRREYIDATFRIPPKVYLTASGMAAFSTAVTTLAAEGRMDGPIMVGRGSYFENKQVLEQFFGDRLVFFDEMHFDGVLAMVKKIQPVAIVIDSLTNTADIAVPDLRRLLPAIARVVTQPTVLILDNTGMATAYQPFVDMPRVPSKLTLVVVESLNKYYQLGMDRVTGGVIWRTGLAPIGFFGSRMHLGTNMPDASVLSLPTPNRALLDKRLARLHRNATLLATALDAHIKTSHTPFSHVVYPGLPSHPAYSWSVDRFHGSFFILAFKPTFSHVRLSKKFLGIAIDEARKGGVDIVAGTSFGFSTTRIYLTALHASKYAKPFLRISVGTETRAEIDALTAIFIRAIDRL